MQVSNPAYQHPFDGGVMQIYSPYELIHKYHKEHEEVVLLSDALADKEAALGELATGNLEAQHRAAVENTKLRTALAEKDKEIAILKRTIDLRNATIDSLTASRKVQEKEMAALNAKLKEDQDRHTVYGMVVRENERLTDGNRIAQEALRKADLLQYQDSQELIAIKNTLGERCCGVEGQVCRKEADHE
jgi:hypothetical protein